MINTSRKTTIYVVTGIILAVSMKFILSFIAKTTISNIITWGYFAKALMWIWLILMYLYSTNIEKQKFLLWNDKKYSPLFILKSVAIIVGLVILSGFVSHIFTLFGFKPENSMLQDEMLENVHKDFILLILTCLTAGIVEELIFRGYLIPRLNLFFKNNYLPVIISSLFFGISHIAYGTVTNVIVPTLLGLIFGYYYQKYRNIKILIIIHVFIDFVNLI